MSSTASMTVSSRRGLTPSAISSLLAAGGGQMPSEPTVKAVLFELYGIYAVPMLGASGAIYGLLVAFGLLHPNVKLALMFVPVPIAAKFFIPILLGRALIRDHAVDGGAG